MQLQYDPNLIEQTIFQAARHDPNLEAELHRATDPLYELADEGEKDARFRDVYQALFRRLELDRLVPGLLAERPHLERAVGRCIVREAPAARKETAELYVKQAENDPGPATRTIIIQICPASLLEPSGFIPRTRRELLQISDMIDPRFGYRKESLAGGQPRENLIRDRYRVSWDVYAEGRLAQEDQGDEEAIRSLGLAFQRVFPGHPATRTARAFERVSEANNLTHDRILEWAESPPLLFEEEDVRPGGGPPVGGQACPVCGFATHDWFDVDDSTGIRSAVRRDFPHWNPTQGICRQCAELYAGAGAL